MLSKSCALAVESTTVNNWKEVIKNVWRMSLATAKRPGFACLIVSMIEIVLTNGFTQVCSTHEFRIQLLIGGILALGVGLNVKPLCHAEELMR
jgi:hypothetical protein